MTPAEMLARHQPDDRGWCSYCGMQGCDAYQLAQAVARAQDMADELTRRDEICWGPQITAALAGEGADATTAADIANAYNAQFGVKPPVWDDAAVARNASRILAGVAHPELDHLLSAGKVGEYETALDRAMETDRQAETDAADRGEP